jgi:hypothetical protein
MRAAREDGGGSGSELIVWDDSQLAGFGVSEELRPEFGVQGDVGQLLPQGQQGLDAVALLLVHVLKIGTRWEDLRPPPEPPPRWSTARPRLCGQRPWLAGRIELWRTAKFTIGVRIWPAWMRSLERC